MPTHKRLKDFLEQINDIELAYFYKYRRKSFIPATRDKIKEEVDKRGINIERILKQNPPFQNKKENRCPRCGTDKRITQKKTTELLIGYEDHQDNKYTPVCCVCNYIDEEKSDTELSHLLRTNFGPFAKVLTWWNDLIKKFS